ncbi:hypothetical protein [Paludisphaera mucosa]|uniref:Uncharacterized protein n=1 Tax=Paludisphaera mucosa TaxID=3030827 RepID=A0ABT6F7S6_9BACT|nr:hypothetical protein [Paludisphaera mucosa]MDG3003618.1 hypothetical protein [Paludisphaera mucosa]
MQNLPIDPFINAITKHPTHGKAQETSPRSSVQEWTGQAWVIVDVLDGPGKLDPAPLDASSFPGQYLGQRIVTA